MRDLMLYLAGVATPIMALVVYAWIAARAEEREYERVRSAYRQAAPRA